MIRIFVSLRKERNINSFRTEHYYINREAGVNGDKEKCWHRIAGQSALVMICLVSCRQI